jgi:hypothetical protein
VAGLPANNEDRKVNVTRISTKVKGFFGQVVRDIENFSSQDNR